MGQHGHAPRLVRQTGDVGGFEAALGHIGGTPVGQPTVEGVVDVLSGARLHQRPGEMGPSHAPLVARLGQDVLVGHPRPQLPQTGCQLFIAHRPVPSELDELVLERPFPRLHEVHEDVHRPLDAGRTQRRGRLAARHLAPRHQPHPEVGRHPACLVEPVQAVVVGERQRRAARLGGQLDDAAWGFRAVGHGGVRVQVDHRARLPAAPICPEPGVRRTVAAVWEGRLVNAARGCAGGTGSPLNVRRSEGNAMRAR